MGCGLVTLSGLGCDSGFSEPSAKPSGQPVSQQWGRPEIGAQAHVFTLLDLKGRPVSLSELKGKVVVLNFWATWCAPCRVEMPGMEMAYQKYKARGFEILAISTDSQGMVVTKPFVEANDLTFPILHDSDYQVGAAYGVRTLPMSYVLDRDGVIRHRIFGARDWNSPEADKLIQQLLTEKPQYD